MILGISKCAQSIPGKISDRPRWSKNIVDNIFMSEKISKEVERTIFYLSFDFVYEGLREKMLQLGRYGLF